jgi:hypothetical protein
MHIKCFVSCTCEFDGKCPFSMFRHIVVKSGGNGKIINLSKSTMWCSAPSDGTSQEARCLLRPMACMRSVALNQANSDIRVLATICCASPTLLQWHHVNCPRGLNTRFEGGDILPSLEAGNLSGSYVEDPGQLVQPVLPGSEKGLDFTSHFRPIIHALKKHLRVYKLRMLMSC